MDEEGMTVNVILLIQTTIRIRIYQTKWLTSWDRTWTDYYGLSLTIVLRTNRKTLKLPSRPFNLEQDMKPHHVECLVHCEIDSDKRRKAASATINTGKIALQTR